MRSLLITGGAGFIGGTFIRQRLASDPETHVVNLDLLTYASNQRWFSCTSIDHRHIFVHGDIADGSLVAELLRDHQPQAVIHFAAESHVDRSIDGPAPFVQTNVVGTFRLLEASVAYWESLPPKQREEFRFLHVSTDEVFGTLEEQTFSTERSPYRPNSPYSATKAASDHLVRAYHQTYGLPTLTTYCCNNYGPYQFPEKLVPLMILNALEGRPLPIYGDGQHTRDWIYVNDHCQALEQVLAEGLPGESYNIGGETLSTNLDLVRRICQLVDHLVPGLRHAPCEGLLQFVQDRPGHDRRYAIDCRKIQEELGWQPAVLLEEGLAKTIGWYIDNRDWANEITNSRYQRERLGLRGGADRSSQDPPRKPSGKSGS